MTREQQMIAALKASQARIYPDAHFERYLDDTTGALVDLVNDMADGGDEHAAAAIRQATEAIQHLRRTRDELRRDMERVGQAYAAWDATPPAPPAEPPDYLAYAAKHLKAAMEKAQDAPASAAQHEAQAAVALNLQRVPTHDEAVNAWMAHPPAVAGEDARLANVFLVTEYRGGGVRGVFKSKAAAEAEIAAICGEHPNLTRSDFVVQVERIRPFPTWGRGTTPTPGAQ